MASCGAFLGHGLCSKACQINSIDDQIMNATHTCSRPKCGYPWVYNHSKARQINGLNNQTWTPNMHANKFKQLTDFK